MQRSVCTGVHRAQSPVLARTSRAHHGYDWRVATPKVANRATPDRWSPEPRSKTVMNAQKADRLGKLSRRIYHKQVRYFWTRYIHERERFRCEHFWWDSFRVRSHHIPCPAIQKVALHVPAQVAIRNDPDQRASLVHDAGMTREAIRAGHRREDNFSHRRIRCDEGQFFARVHDVFHSDQFSSKR